MATSTSTTFQTWTLEKQDQPSIADLLARVNNERGHFRHITEASLQEELANEGALELSDSDEEDEGGEEEQECDENVYTKPTSREDLFKAKYDMLQKVSFAHNEIMMALDFISLLGSKQTAASKQTMSQYLKTNVPAGTLGTDVWHRMPKDQAREQQDALLAHNVRMQALQSSADTILSAAKNLEENVRKEIRYWNEVLSVTEAGWNVCRMPGQQHKLGVRFGFNGSSAEFSRGGIAALQTESDGSISLQRSAQTASKVLRATIRQNGRIIAVSNLTSSTQRDASLETKIRHARESLFDEELFREIQKEGRSLLAAGVVFRGQSIVVPSSTDSNDFSIGFELTARDAEISIADGRSNASDALAQGALCAARMLLCQAHRRQLEQRSQLPAPMSEKKVEDPPYLILRPLMAFSSHRAAIQKLNACLAGVSSLLQKASVSSSFDAARVRLLESYDIQQADQLAANLLSTHSAEAVYRISSDNQAERMLHVMVETTATHRNGDNMFSVAEHGSPTQRLLTFQQAKTSIGWMVGKWLCTGLSEREKSGWQVDGRSPRLYRQGNAAKDNVKEVVVQLDAEEQALSITSDASEVEWSIAGESSSQSLWEAWKMVTSA